MIRSSTPAAAMAAGRSANVSTEIGRSMPRETHMPASPRFSKAPGANS